MVRGLDAFKLGFVTKVGGDVARDDIARSNIVVPGLEADLSLSNPPSALRSDGLDDLYAGEVPLDLLIADEAATSAGWQYDTFGEFLNSRGNGGGDPASSGVVIRTEASRVPVAMGSTARRLMADLNSPISSIWLHAVWALTEIRSSFAPEDVPSVVEALFGVVPRCDKTNIVAVTWAIGFFNPPPEVIDPLLKSALTSRDPIIRRNALFIFSQISNTRLDYVDHLIRALDDPFPEVVSSALFLFKFVGTKGSKAVAALRDFAERTGSNWHQQQALEAAVRIESAQQQATEEPRS